MNDYVLVCNGPKVALTTRDTIHLDDSFWQRFVRHPESLFQNADTMLSDLESSLQWFDVTQVGIAHRHGDLLICPAGNAFSFAVMQGKVPLTVAMCELKNGQLYPVPIVSLHKCDVILWENLVDHWRDFFKKAFYNAYGFDPHDAYGIDPRGWPHYIRRLYTFAQSES
jgi:hypothetical protein